MRRGNWSYEESHEARRRNYEATFANRFWARVKKSRHGCWEWVGSRFPKGYGSVKRQGKHLQSHRVSWELCNGKIPSGQCVLHHCDNPPCVRPDHLFLGSKKDNIVDAVKKGRWPPKYGSYNGRSKLSEKQAKAIRQDFSQRRYRGQIAALAREFKLGETTVAAIRDGITWKHV